jgi:hypothetical protein
LNYNHFCQFTKEWTKHLSGETDLGFYSLLNLSKHNGRFRNVFVYFVLTNEFYFRKFKNLAKKDKQVLEMKNNLVKALLRLQNENNSAASLASYLFVHYFKEENSVKVNDNNYDVSAEMAKLMKTMVNGFESDNNLNEDKKAHRKKLLNKVNMAELIS